LRFGQLGFRGFAVRDLRLRGFDGGRRFRDLGFNVLDEFICGGVFRRARCNLCACLATFGDLGIQPVEFLLRFGQLAASAALLSGAGAGAGFFSSTFAVSFAMSSAVQPFSIRKLGNVGFNAAMPASVTLVSKT
jgi:hypothetical protein